MTAGVRNFRDAEAFANPSQKRPQLTWLDTSGIRNGLVLRGFLDLSGSLHSQARGRAALFRRAPLLDSGQTVEPAPGHLIVAGFLSTRIFLTGFFVGPASRMDDSGRSVFGCVRASG